jgi:hypothetical protein
MGVTLFCFRYLCRQIVSLLILIYMSNETKRKVLKTNSVGYEDLLVISGLY